MPLAGEPAQFGPDMLHTVRSTLRPINRGDSVATGTAVKPADCPLNTTSIWSGNRPPNGTCQRSSATVTRRNGRPSTLKWINRKLVGKASRQLSRPAGSTSNEAAPKSDLSLVQLTAISASRTRQSSANFSTDRSSAQELVGGPRKGLQLQIIRGGAREPPWDRIRLKSASLPCECL